MGMQMKNPLIHAMKYSIICVKTSGFALVLLLLENTPFSPAQVTQPLSKMDSYDSRGGVNGGRE